MDAPAPAPPPAAAPAPTRRPAALVISVVFGAIGAVLLVIGFVAGNEPMVLSAVAAGTVSLVSVLVWREQLITAWRTTGKQRR